jgi:hypothetical protein
MTTQATGPAQAQVQQPVHPIHEETATLNALTQWVSETPDNDPHAGTDLEEPKPPVEQKAEVKEEPKEEVKAEAQEELDEDAPLFEIEYKTDSGKEIKKLSLKEMREGFLAKQDYHRNIQKVQKERAEIAEQAKQAELKAIQEYAQRLEMQKQAVTKLAGVKSMQEIEQLSREDPAAAQQEFLRMLSVNQTLQQIEAEQSQAHQKLQEERKAAIAREVEKSRQTLASDIPNWSEETYQKVLKTVSDDYGFESKDVAEVYDSRLIKVFHDAYQFRQLQKAKPEISKRVVAVPKVVKPGSGEKPNTANEAAQEAFSRLKKTGRLDDAAAAYLAMQKQQKR